MANKALKLILVGKTDKGWQRLPVVIGGNGRLRAGYAKIGGEDIHIPGSYYAIRSYERTKTVYRSLKGMDVFKVKDEFEKARRLTFASIAAAQAETRLVEDDASENYILSERRLKWLAKLASDGKDASVQTMTTAIDDFLEATGHTRSGQITEESMTALYLHLRRNQGNSDRTISNKTIALNSWFKSMNLDAKKIIRKSVKYTHKEVESYEMEEISALIASVKSTYFKVVIHLLHKSGMRMQEAMFLKWVDVDFHRNEIRVREDIQAGFTIKDHAERTISLHPALRDVLLQWRPVRAKAELVVGTPNDKPNWKWLQTLKRAARAAGLNCGSCKGCKSKSNECRRWYIHKFRATYTTTLLRAIDARSVMDQTGHANLATVMRYWKALGRKEVAEKIAHIRFD